MAAAVSAPFQLAGPNEFGQRAGSLAAALDCLSTLPGAVDGAVAEEVAAPTEPAGLTCDIPEEPEVEISAAAARRAACTGDAYQDVGGDLQDDSDSDDVDDDEDGEAEVCDAAKQPGIEKRKAKRAQRQRREERLPEERPRGAPDAEPASFDVLDAVTAAGGGACAVRAAPRSEKQKHGAKAALDFGPRFQGLSSTAVAKAKASWKLYSLADVRESSSEDNRRAAATLLEDLRRRREQREGGASQDPPEETDCAKKLVFRKPPRRDLNAPVASQAGSAATGNHASSTVPGARVMEECLAGSKRRATGPPGQETSAEATAPAAQQPPARRRRTICVGQDDGDDC